MSTTTLQDWDDILSWLVDINPDDIYEELVETAMQRSQVKKSRRPHVARTLDVFFEEILMRARNWVDYEKSAKQASVESCEEKTDEEPPPDFQMTITSQP